MKLRSRRALSLLLAAVMVLGLLPTAAFATDGEGQPPADNGDPSPQINTEAEITSLC